MAAASHYKTVSAYARSLRGYLARKTAMTRASPNTLPEHYHIYSNTQLLASSVANASVFSESHDGDLKSKLSASNGNNLYFL